MYTFYVVYASSEVIIAAKYEPIKELASIRSKTKLAAEVFNRIVVDITTVLQGLLRTGGFHRSQVFGYSSLCTSIFRNNFSCDTLYLKCLYLTVSDNRKFF